MNEKLQKVLARAGLGSRRQLEHWIEEGRITVDGVIATLGARVTSGQKICVDGRVVPAHASEPKNRVLIYHKPAGEVCTRSDPEGRKTIFENMPRLRGARWVSVGRLDYNTSGLLLLTTDGELANRLMHPSSEIEREYAVRVLGKVETSTLDQLRRGVMLDDGPAHFDNIVEAGGEGANRWFHVTLKEGRQREVRRLWEALGFQVSRLMRIRFGLVALPPHLRTGQFVDLDETTAAELYQSVELTPPPIKKPRVQRATRKPKDTGARLERVSTRHGGQQHALRRRKPSPR